MEVDGGIMEGVSAGLRGPGASWVAEWDPSELWRRGSHSTSAPWCSAGRPDPQGLHCAELPPGPPFARAEDPRGPQYAGPQVPRAGGEQSCRVWVWGLGVPGSEPGLWAEGQAAEVALLEH